MCFKLSLYDESLTRWSLSPLSGFRGSNQSGLVNRANLQAEFVHTGHNKSEFNVYILTWTYWLFFFFSFCPVWQYSQIPRVWNYEVLSFQEEILSHNPHVRVFAVLKVWELLTFSKATNGENTNKNEFRLVAPGCWRIWGAKDLSQTTALTIQDSSCFLHAWGQM